MEERKVLSESNEVKVYSDPYRLEILEVFYKADQPVTVKQVADTMGETPAKVHYHVKKMEKVNILELVYTKEINGIIAKYYEPTARLFVIEGKDYDKESSLVIKNNLERVIIKEFDDNKKNFVEGLRIAGNNIKCDGIFSSDKIYLTEDEFLEITKFIDSFGKKKDCHKENQKNKKKYQYIFSIMGVEKKQ